jgi:hypothetical protein
LQPHKEINIHLSSFTIISNKHKSATDFVDEIFLHEYYLLFQTAMLLLRIDDIVSGTKKQSDVNAPPKAAPEAEAQVPEGPES